jgi:hypothetical protein
MVPKMREQALFLLTQLLRLLKINSWMNIDYGIQYIAYSLGVGIWGIGVEAPEKMAQIAKKRENQGLKLIKIKLENNLCRDIERIQTIRANINPKNAFSC